MERIDIAGNFLVHCTVQGDDEVNYEGKLMMGNSRRNLRAMVLVMIAVLAACSDSQPIVTEGAVADDSAPASEPFDDPTPPTIDPDDRTEYEQFRWQDGVVDGYAMTYTQKCGDLYRADEPRSVWVEGGYFRASLSSTVREQNLVSIPELIEVTLAEVGGGNLTSFVEGDIGQPEQIHIEDSNGEQTFCFELLNFAGSTKDGEGRMLVPLLYEAEAFDTNETEFSVGVASCNGSPTFTLVEDATTITVTATTWFPNGNDRSDCLDVIRVDLDAPIGDRQIVDGFSGLTMPLLTDAILNQPKPLEQVACDDDVPDCRAQFQIGTNLYAVTCFGVADVGVSDFNFASGVIDGQPVEMFQIKSVGVNIMLAVDVTSGDCSDRAVGPIAGVEQAWSVAVRLGNDPDQLSRFLCSLADLSEAQRIEQRCDRFE